MTTRQPIYVTFIFKPAPIFKAQGQKTVRFAIKCDTMKQAREAGADVNGIDGLSHLYINKCGRKVNIMVKLNIVALVDESVPSVDDVLERINITATGDDEFVDVESCEVDDFSWETISVKCLKPS